MIQHSFCLFAIFIVTLTHAQRKTQPTQEDKVLAAKLLKSFPEKDVALNTHQETIVFGYSKSNKKVTVDQTIHKDYLNLATRSDILDYIFYDGESEITKSRVFYRDKKKRLYGFKDEAYKSNGLFHEDTRVRSALLSFPVKAHRFYVNYDKHYKDVKYFTQVFFNQEYPVKEKTIVFEIPSWLDVELKEMNFNGYQISKNVSKNPDNGNNVYTYKVYNLNSMHKEPNTPGPTYIYPHILVLPKSHTAEGAKVNIFNSTKDLYAWYKSLVDDLENNTGAIKAKVEELTKDAKSDDEKIKNIYYWVQDNIRYIAFEDGIAGFKPDEAENVFNKRYGDCKGMANLIKHMLVLAGFDARLTWIGTKRIAYDYSTPNLSVDNHMICTLFKDDEVIYLDGTESFNPFGEYANRIQGKEVLIENGDDFMLKKVPVAANEFNKEQVAYNLTIKGEDITGTGERIYKGESRSRIIYFLNSIKSDKKEDFLNEVLTNQKSNISVSNTKTSDKKNREIDFKVNYDLNIKNAVSEFDDLIYVDLDIDKELNNFNFEERKTDYIFKLKKNLSSTTKLNIPEGYTINYVPENINVDHPNFNLSVSFKNNGNELVYKKEYLIKNAKIEVKDFPEWNAFIKKLNDLYNDQIVLKKS